MRAESRPFTVDEYEAMARAGILTEEDRVELVEGVIVEMAPIDPPHAGTVNTLARLLIRELGDRAVVGVQNPVRLPPYSEPQPDLAVLRPSDDNYASRHPSSEDTLLCIEVAQTSVRRDRTKTSMYAREGISEVWIVNIPDRRLEVYRNPEGERYATVELIGPGRSISPLAFPELTVAVDDILPAAS